MLALFNFIPKFCPNCGADTKLDDDQIAYFDFQMRAAIQCRRCGLHYQRANGTQILEAAKLSGGDLYEKVPNEEDEASLTMEQFKRKRKKRKKK